jgi:hypothetical protein
LAIGVPTGIQYGLEVWVFMTVSLVMGEPFEVAADAGEADLEAARQLLERRLHALETRARAMLQ